MNPDDALTIALAAALFGALAGGFLGYFGQRFLQTRDFNRRGRDAGRAVYYEMTLNKSAIQASIISGRLVPDVSRRTLDATMPVLSGWLRPKHMYRILIAYIGSTASTGYAQPFNTSDIKKMLIIVEDHARALDLLHRLAFGDAEKLEAMKDIRSEATREGWIDELDDDVKADRARRAHS